MTENVFETRDEHRQFLIRHTMKQYLYGLLVLGVSVCLTYGDPLVNRYTDRTNGFSITSGFIPDTSSIIVGEPLFLTFVVSNHTDKLFQFRFFADSNFEIVATNSIGKPVKNLNLGGGYSGGGTHVSVSSIQPYYERVFLNKWCGFDQPDDYTITCRYTFRDHSSGWGFFGPKIITAFKLTVLPTDPKRITEIIESWGRVVETNGPLHEAALAMAAINDPRTIPYLALLVMKGSDINYIAVHALARFTNNLAAADALTDALKNGDEHMTYVPQVASTALRGFHQSDRAASKLLSGLTNTDSDIRIQTAQAISWTGSELAFEPLNSLLQDKSNSVRYAAAHAIGRLGSKRSYVTLTNLLTDPDHRLRLAAVKGLVALNCPFQTDWLTPIIRAAHNNEANFRTYHEAIVLMALSGGKQVAPGLVSCLDFGNPSVKDWYNFYLLQYIEDHDGLKYYYKWQHDPNRDGSPEELAENRRILSELKAWLANHK
ncbi:MAG: HEAT repeat domain-containing protein [Verrucomicrobiota bacterium]